jgi:hypothetical protein
MRWLGLSPRKDMIARIDIGELRPPAPNAPTQSPTRALPPLNPAPLHPLSANLLASVILCPQRLSHLPSRLARWLAALSPACLSVVDVLIVVVDGMQATPSPPQTTTVKRVMTEGKGAQCSSCLCAWQMEGRKHSPPPPYPPTAHKKSQATPAPTKATPAPVGR